MLAKWAGEGGNADSWIVVEGLEKNGETRGALSSGFRFEEGAARGSRSLQGGSEERKQRMGGW